VDTKNRATASPWSSHSIPKGTTTCRCRGMVDVQNSVVVDRLLAVVSRYAADPDNAPLRYVNIQSVEWLTPRPLRCGAHRGAFEAVRLTRDSSGSEMVRVRRIGPDRADSSGGWARLRRQSLTVNALHRIDTSAAGSIGFATCA
jgi:hypothetical protein